LTGGFKGGRWADATPLAAPAGLEAGADVDAGPAPVAGAELWALDEAALAAGAWAAGAVPPQAARQRAMTETTSADPKYPRPPQRERAE